MKQLSRLHLLLGRLQPYQNIHSKHSLFRPDCFLVHFFSTDSSLSGPSAKSSKTLISSSNSAQLRGSPNVSASINKLIASIPSRIQPLNPELSHLVSYQLTSTGKHVRPTFVWLISRLVHSPSSRLQNASFDTYSRSQSPSSIAAQPISPTNVNEAQDTVARVCELIHTASLVHDDLLDSSDTRRGRPSVQQRFSHSHAIMSGDYLMSVSTQMLAQLGRSDVIEILAQVLDDLVSGELLQLGGLELFPSESARARDRALPSTERLVALSSPALLQRDAPVSALERALAHCLGKTYRKTASLIANFARAAAVLATSDAATVHSAFEVGRHYGMAFQLTDDLLDLTGTEAQLGKPAGGDLRAGVVTVPVLLAARQWPELARLTRSRAPADIERAHKLVLESEGINATRALARAHVDESLRHIELLERGAHAGPSPHADALRKLVLKVLSRTK